MDALLFMILALVMAIKVSNETEEVPVDIIAETVDQDIERVAKLNESFYEDPNAFCEIINALGFPKEAP